MKKKVISTSMVRAPLCFAGLNMARIHKNGYIRNTKGLLISVEEHGSVPAFGSLFLLFKLSIQNYLKKKFFFLKGDGLF